MSDPIFEGDVVKMKDDPESPEMTVTKIDAEEADCLIEGAEAPGRYALEELTFVRRYSVGRTELTAGEERDDA